MDNKNTSKRLAYLSLGVGILSVGFSAIFIRWANAPGIVSSFYRMGTASVVMTLPFYQRIRYREGLPKQGVNIAILGGLFFAADIAFWASGVMLSGATNPTLLANTAPLWVGLGALFLFREKLKVKFWAGLILAMTGAVGVLGLDALRSTSLGIGTFLGLLASFFYGGYLLITQRGRESLDALSYFWISAVTSTIGLLFLALAFRQPLIGYSLQTFLNFLAMGLVTQVLGYLTINYALGHLSATLVSPTLLGQPIVTAFLAGPLLGENLNLLQIVGGIVVILGVYLVHTSRTGAR